MKTKKIGLSILMTITLLIATSGIAQEKKDYVLVELTYMMPKIGMENALVKAVTEHNKKFHSTAPYQAQLDRIVTGPDTGWYVWVMAPTMFKSLDNRPSKGAHDEHWDKVVAPNIKKYGRTEYWRYNDKLSFNPDKNRPKLENIWITELEDNTYYRFKALMKKIKKAFEKKGDDNFLIYENQFNANDGREIAFVWGLKNWAEFDDDDGGIKKDYEEIHGKGSWEDALKEWRSIVKGLRSELWEIAIDK
ncbi:MAG: hypothetical protein ACWA42_05215 [Lutibacter sp.]